MNGSPNRKPTEYVWKIRSIGGNPVQIHAEILDAIARLRAGEPTHAHLDSDQVQPWVDNVGSSTLSDPIVVGVWSFILVDLRLIHTKDPAGTATALSAGFSFEIVNRIRELPGIGRVTHGTPVPRSPGAGDIFSPTTPLMLGVDALNDLISEARGQQANILLSARRAAVTAEVYALSTRDGMSRMAVTDVLFGLVTDLMLLGEILGVSFDQIYSRAKWSFSEVIRSTES